MAEILLNNVTKIYKKSKTVAVNNLTLECKDKEFIAILGTSGAGKTSTLKMIAGIEDISSGELFINRKNMTNESIQNRNVSMVFESYALYPHFTVRENLAFPLKAPGRAHKMTNSEVDAKVLEWAQIVGLDELLDRKPSQLSGGQRQRVSLARALVRSQDASVVLMDEPIAHLDAKLRNSMRGELKRLHNDLGTTFIYVTHDYTEAMAMADRIAVINKGELMQFGTPKEIYENPQNEFVASTVGEPPMNFMTGRLVNDDFIYKDQTLRLPCPTICDGNIDLGIRPTELKIIREKDDEMNCFSGPVQVILPTGSKQIVEVNISGKLLFIKTDRSQKYEKDEMVYVKPDFSKICFFDSETKKRVSPVIGDK
ncbi:MAG: ABC transporter ATP-binding protein [Flexilinea sp.]